MAEVVEIAKPEMKTKGDARCLLCGHAWQATVESGTIFFACPQCETNHGTFHNTVLNDDRHWHCQCGGSLFHITPAYVYCPICGGHQDFGKSVV